MEISKAALARLGLDAVWWLVTPGNPLKDQALYGDYEKRLRRARRFADHPNIVVSDFERRHDTQYTVNTLARILELNPKTKFVWLMGADSLKNFHLWRDWREVAQSMPFAVFNRPGYTDDALHGEAATELQPCRLIGPDRAALATTSPPAWAFFEHTQNPASSTSLRKAAAMLKPRTADLEAPYGPLAYFLDLHPALGDFRNDVLAGLAQKQKTTSPMYFYDEAGSQLFNRITELEEYYPTRTEAKLFAQIGGEVGKEVGPDAAVFEYGSGSSEKIKWLLDGLHKPAAYVAMDISRDHLLENASRLAREINEPPVAAICADFNAHIELPPDILPAPKRWLGYFPGSTIGNLTPENAKRLLQRASDTLGEDALFLLGVDLKKDPKILNAAYNDAKGVTAAFNLNLLVRMKRELGAEIEISDFEHHAFFNEEESRIEMHLRAVKASSIRINDQLFEFVEGETLHTENSYKYSIQGIEGLTAGTPWSVKHVWQDEAGWYAACLLSNS